jgi:hypothetical protein
LSKSPTVAPPKSPVGGMIRSIAPVRDIRTATIHWKLPS